MDIWEKLEKVEKELEETKEELEDSGRVCSTNGSIPPIKATSEKHTNRM